MDDKEFRIGNLKTQYYSVLEMPDSMLKAAFLTKIGINCYESIEQLQSLEVADLAISALEKVVDLKPEDQRLLLTMFNAIGEASMKRFALSRDVGDINRSISAWEKSVEFTPEDDLQELSDNLNNLGGALCTRFELTEDLKDITNAIELHRKVAALTPDRLQSELSLPICLMHRFKFTRDVNDINEAIVVTQKAIDDMDAGNPRYGAFATNLVTALKRRFEHSGDHSDIKRAIELQQKAIDQVPNDHPDFPAYLTNLGVIYQEYFVHAGDLSHIGLAIECQRRALVHSTAGTQKLPGFFLNLGTSLYYRYFATGDAGDLEEAISLTQQAIQICDDDDPMLRLFYTNLGSLFYYRAVVTDALQDKHEAVNAHREGVLRTPTGHQDLPGILNNLGNALKRLFDFTSDMSHLEEAVSCFRDAVRMTADGDIKLLSCLSNLGWALCTRFERTHRKRDLIDGLDALRQAVALCPPNHAGLSYYTTNLSTSLITQFENERRLEILDEAITVVERALNIVPEGHLEYSCLLDRLGDLFNYRGCATVSADDLEKALSLYRQATLIPNAVPSRRLDSGMHWGTLAFVMTLSPGDRAMEAFEAIFDDIVPRLAWIGRTMEQRYTLLTNLANTVTLATSVAVLYEHRHTAIEWLEQGRSIVWNQINTFRTPLDELEKVEPVLCKELEHVANALQDAGMRQMDESSDTFPAMTHKIAIQNYVRKHQELAARWDSLLSQVRAINGFEDFLRPIPFFKLVRTLPSAGFVIVVNVSEFGCGALVLTRGTISTGESVDPLHVPLPKIYDRVVSLREKLHAFLLNPSTRTRSVRAGRLASSDPHISLKEVLQGLWYEIVKPIIDNLELKPTSDPPRIWWCPTGPLAFLPLHAAGDYNDPNPGSNITDYVISSYTPTITILTQGITRHNQRQKQNSSSSFKGLLVVSEPEAPDLPPIPSTTQETHILRELFKSSSLAFHSLDKTDATVDSVMYAMPSYNWIHLSCHALQNDTPLKSAFYLHDGQLSLGEIIKQPLPDAEFAFLSACETGKGDKKLSEEAVHLAAGMLAAGYTSVVATMWSISDIYAPLVADAFYSNMLLTEEGRESSDFQPDCTRSAAALHRAIKHFRDHVGDDEEGLLLWVPYIHVGI